MKKIDNSSQISITDISDRIIGSSHLLTECKNSAVKIAGSDAPVLITGESGTGKEEFANLIYLESKRYKKPFIKVNCAAIPESLIETELFGHVKGAFTDASSERKGKFIAADTGTIFLDEIAEIPIHIQPRLLRVIETGVVDQVGSDIPYKVDVRIIAATNKNLIAAINSGNFREDLFYRLNVLSLQIPPLRTHKSDIPLLIDYFIKQNNSKISFTADALNQLAIYSWPGNIRELKNLIEQVSVIYKDKIITAADLNLKINDEKSIQPLKNAINKFKKKYIIDALEANNWNQSKTASVLDIQRTYLSRLIKDLKIDKE